MWSLNDLNEGQDYPWERGTLAQTALFLPQNFLLSSRLWYCIDRQTNYWKVADRSTKSKLEFPQRPAKLSRWQQYSHSSSIHRGRCTRVLHMCWITTRQEHSIGETACLEIQYILDKSEHTYGLLNLHQVSNAQGTIWILRLPFFEQTEHTWTNHHTSRAAFPQHHRIPKAEIIAVTKISNKHIHLGILYFTSYTRSISATAW